MIKNICFNYKMEAEPAKRIKLIEEAGFDGVFLYSQYHPREYIDLIFKSKLNIETLHLPYKRFEENKLIDSQYVNSLWREGIEGDKYVSWLIDEVKFANRYGIKNVIAHITGGIDPPVKNEIGIKRISEVLDVCENCEIDFCLENLRRIDYLEYVFERINSERLKFCFDSGHANAYTKNIEIFPWHIFGKKIKCVHLHDNDGVTDQHLPPLEGNIDWEKLINILFKYNPNIELTLEVRSSKDQKNKYTETEYLNLCFASISKIESLILK